MYFDTSLASLHTLLIVSKSHMLKFKSSQDDIETETESVSIHGTYSMGKTMKSAQYSTLSEVEPV